MSIKKTTLLFILVIKASICPSGWILLESSCYYFSTFKTTGFKAIDVCQRMGGNLAVPKNIHENDAILKVIQQKSLGTTNIGILMRRNQRKFYTVKGVLPTFLNWAPGEPRPGGNHNHCVGITLPSGKWDDYSCNELIPFVCQREITKTCRYSFFDVDLI